MSVIVIEFITLDGIVSDPDGSGGTPAGGWAFRHGPEAVAGDKFRLGSVLDDGVLLLGRKTWELFSRIWPGRDDPFSTRMNAAPKLVASRTLTDASAWQNSQAVDGDHPCPCPPSGRAFVRPPGHTPHSRTYPPAEALDWPGMDWRPRPRCSPGLACMAGTGTISARRKQGQARTGSTCAYW